MKATQTRVQQTLWIAMCWLMPSLAAAQTAGLLERYQKEPHLGVAAEALVGVEVRWTLPDGTVQSRRGNGALLRCDGFTLAPASLFAEPTGVANAQPIKREVLVTLHPGSEKAKIVRAPYPALIGSFPTSAGKRRLPYVVLKLQNVHALALRTLLPDSLTPKDRLTVWWSAWDASRNAFAPVQSAPTQLRDEERSNEVESSLQAVNALPVGLPVGAVVSGTDGLGVGILARPERSEIATFTYLNWATNCVSAVPLPDSAFALKHPQLVAPPKEEAALEPERKAEQEEPEKEEPTAPPVPGRMVAVPGGAIRLPEAIRLSLRAEDRSEVVCVAPFQIDQYEVTNGEYFAYWKSLPAKKRRDVKFRLAQYPVGWADNESQPFPDDLTNVPVLGVRLEGAEGYAKWAGKRLPTPAEWALAAFGQSGGVTPPRWVPEYIAYRNNAWTEVRRRHVAYLEGLERTIVRNKIAETIRLYNAQRILERARGGAASLPDSNPVLTQYPDEAFLLHLPWFLITPPFREAAIWSRSVVEEAQQKLIDSPYAVTGLSLIP